MDNSNNPQLHLNIWILGGKISSLYSMLKL